jgi:hypothetical protein
LFVVPCFGTRVSGDPSRKHFHDLRRARVDQQINVDPPTEAPEDARKATEEQQDLQDKLEHQDDDPDAPGLQQSHHNVADESHR